MTPRYLTTAEAAAYVGLSVWAFKARRRKGIGPPAVKLGHSTVRYDVQDLDLWMRRHREAS